MHFHLPKPLHGWREFAGEVGVIVLGVLIALGLEQIVQSIHERNIAAEARENVRDEAALNLSAIRDRIDVQPCIERRLDELSRILFGQAMAPYGRSQAGLAYRRPGRSSTPGGRLPRQVAATAYSRSMNNSVSRKSTRCSAGMTNIRHGNRQCGRNFVPSKHGAAPSEAKRGFLSSMRCSRRNILPGT